MKKISVPEMTVWQAKLLLEHYIANTGDVTLKAKAGAEYDVQAQTVRDQLAELCSKMK
jgi:hypothetical protein